MNTLYVRLLSCLSFQNVLLLQRLRFVPLLTSRLHSAEFDLGHIIQLPGLRLSWVILIIKCTNKKAALGTVPGTLNVLNQSLLAFDKLFSRLLSPQDQLCAKSSVAVQGLVSS